MGEFTAEKPLLTIAIPTFNRSPFLAELLGCLQPQLSGCGEVELLISDNASTDDTAAMLAGFVARGLGCQVVRNETNVGPDGNFLQCLERARGQYVWVLGDDDLLMERTVPHLVSLLRQGEAGGGIRFGVSVVIWIFRDVCDAGRACAQGPAGAVCGGGDGRRLFFE